MADSESVSVSGPLFDGRAEAALREGVAAVRTKVADKGEDFTRSAFAGSIRVDTGRFLGSVTTVRESRVLTTESSGHTYSLPVVVDDPDKDAVITTGQAAYGPWLEGTGSRNETTRFKGYHGFRIAAQQLNSVAGNLADSVMAPYVDRMN